MIKGKASLQELLLHVTLGRPLRSSQSDELVLVVSGSRKLQPQQVYPLLNRTPLCQSATWLYHGAAEGVDTWVAHYFREVRRLSNRRIIPYEITPAQWRIQGPKAGPQRNRQMLQEARIRADSLGCRCECLVVWDGTSPGTRSVLEEAPKMGFVPEAYVWDNLGFYRKS